MQFAEVLSAVENCRQVEGNVLRHVAERDCLDVAAVLDVLSHHHPHSPRVVLVARLTLKRYLVLCAEIDEPRILKEEARDNGALNHVREAVEKHGSPTLLDAASWVSLVAVLQQRRIRLRCYLLGAGDAHPFSYSPSRR